MITREFYIDDLLNGASSKEETIKLRNDLSEILKQAGMELTKWSTNYPESLKKVIQADGKKEGGKKNMKL